MDGKPYGEVLAIETTKPSLAFWKFADHYGWGAKNVLADRIRERVPMRHGSVCAYLGCGRDARKITVPLMHENRRLFDELPHDPIYRLQVYLDPEVASKKEDVARVVCKMFDLA